jgi:PAS domain S-box-containing protein
MKSNNVDILKQMEQQFPGLFEVVVEGVLILDLKSQKFISHNENAVKMLKYSSEEILGMGPVDVSPEFQPDGARSDEKAMELIARTVGGERLVLEWLLRNGEQKMCFFEVRLALLCGQGDSALIYASFIDISERKKGEEILLRQNEQLEQIGFLQSHQVRSPIANILGLISLFNFKDLNDPINSELILKIHSVSKQFDELIKKISHETKKIEHLTFGCSESDNGICDPTALCTSIKSCFRKNEGL